MYRIELLPARHGDCILVEYGGEGGTIHRILVDGGPLGAFAALERRLRMIPETDRELELMVVTHIDADHIDGAVKLLNHPDLADARDIWFNGWPQVSQPLYEPDPAAAGTARGALGGMFLGARIEGRHWNGHFDGDPIFVPERGALPALTLPGGMRITLLSPDLKGLRKLRSHWEHELEKKGLADATPEEIEALLGKRRQYRTADREQRKLDILASAQDAATRLDAAVANESSIAFIAEFDGKRCAFLADSHMPLVERSLRRFAQERGEARVRLDAVKLSHHGSAGNVSDAFMALVDCDRYLVSTDGSIFRHPDDEAIRMVLGARRGTRMHFNYRCERTGIWDEPELRDAFGHDALFPDGPEGGIAVDLAGNAGARGPG